MTSGSRGADPIRSLVNARSLQLECARVLHESSYGSETMILKEKERSWIRAVHMYNLRCFAG